MTEAVTEGLGRRRTPWRLGLGLVGLAVLAALVWFEFRPFAPDAHRLDVQAMQEATALLKDGKREAALDVLEKRLTEHPDSLELGNFYRASAVSVKLQDRPIHFLVGLSESMPSPPDVLRYNLAFAYIDKIPVVGPMGAGFLSKRAIKQFQTVVDKEPDDWIANYGIGMNYLHWPEYFEKNDDSMHYFEKCLEIQAHAPKRPYFVLTAIRLGDAYAKVGQVEKAREAWRKGLESFPNFSDLTSRLALSDADTVSVIKEMYNPNNSIGEINTDVSILWADQLPDSTLPLKRVAIANGGRGIGGQFVAEQADTSDARYFAWFKKNLPVLVHRADAGKIDLKGLGSTEENDSRGIGIIANDMIRGFMTQLQEEDHATTARMLDEASAFDRPFLHEGIGMGLAASLDTEADGSLAAFSDRIAAFDPAFRRLHFAGLGMWFGLSPTINLVHIRKQFAELSLQGQMYAYEGLGFSTALFHQGGKGEGGLDVAERLPFAAASSFAHGAGRAMWVKFGPDMNSVNEALGGLSERLRPDALSGFGMGVAFTRINHPEDFFTVGEQLSRATGRGCADFMTGLAMGLGVRDAADRGYVDRSLAAADPEVAREANRLRAISLNAQQSLRDAQVEDLHGNWRKAMRESIDNSQPAQASSQACRVAS